MKEKKTVPNDQIAVNTNKGNHSLGKPCRSGMNIKPTNPNCRNIGSERFTREIPRTKPFASAMMPETTIVPVSV